MDNERYKWYKENHPDWSDEQIWTAISIDMKAKDVSKKGDGNIDINDPDIIKRVLDGAREWLANVLPDIFEKVKDAFAYLIDSIAKWAQKGLTYVVDAIAYLLNRQ